MMKNKFNHHFNPLNGLYPKLRNLGVSVRTSLYICGLYETKLYIPLNRLFNLLQHKTRDN